VIRINILIDSETPLLIQCFEGAHRGNVFIRLSVHSYMNIYLYCVSKKTPKCSSLPFMRESKLAQPVPGIAFGNLVFNS
jgi:hypothetical protein